MATSAKLSKRVTKASKVMKITEDRLWTYLEQLGIEKDDKDALEILEAETTKEGCAREIFVDKGEVKIARFAAGWEILKGKNKKKEPERKEDISALLKSSVPLANRSNEEILQEYKKPSEASDNIVDELMKRSRGNPFVIYQEDKEHIDLYATLHMLTKARRGQTKRDHAIREGNKTKYIRLYRANEFPSVIVEISPIFPSVVLNDGFCEKCNDTWDGIDIKDRVIVRIATESGGAFDKNNSREIHDLIARIRKEDAGFLLDYPEVSRHYHNLEEEGKLQSIGASLRRRLTFSISGKRDPLNPQ